MPGFCLGLELLGNCLYEPKAPVYHVISVGESITTVAVVIAFSQLLTPNLKARLNDLFPRLYISWGIGVFLVLVAALLPIVPWPAAPIVGYPIVWETLGTIVIIGTILKLLWTFNRPLKFDADTARNIKNLCSRIIATGEERDHAELACSLRSIVKTLVSTLKSEMANRIIVNQNDPKVPPLITEAKEIVRICSDEKFCASVVKREPEFAIRLFDEIVGQEAFQNNNFAILVRELARQAILNPESILHRERNYKGLGYAREFTKSLFTNWDLIERLYPLSATRLGYDQNISIETIDCFGDVACQILEAYVRADHSYEISLTLNYGFNELLTYAGYLARDLDLYDADQVHGCESMKKLSQISFALVSAIRILEGNTKYREVSYINYWKTKTPELDYSVFENVAKWVFKFLQALSHTRLHDEDLRLTFIGIWMEVYPLTSGETAFHREVQDRLEKKISEKLKINFEQGGYPAISRPLLTVLGLFENQIGNGEDRVRSLVFKMLRESFPLLYSLDAKRALDKLPAQFIYDSQRKSLTHSLFLRDVRTVYLEQDKHWLY